MTSLFLIIILTILGTMAYGGLRAAPWVPTRTHDLSRMLALAHIKKGEHFVDLGCGDGRILCAAADAGAVAFGYELSLLPFVFAHLRRLFHVKKNISIVYGDFWHHSLADADIVYFFLMEKIFPRLITKLRNELKPGAKVISYAWPLPGWEITAMATADGKLPIYMHTKPVENKKAPDVNS